MKIKSIRLKNYRGFIDKEIPLNDQFNVIIGDNGTGKTSVLDALALALSTYFLGIDSQYSKSILDKDIRKDVFSENIEPQLPVMVVATGIIGGKEYMWMRNQKTEKGNTLRSMDSNAIVAIAKNDQERVRKNEEVSLPVFAYYGTGRLWNERKSSQKVRKKASRFDGYTNSLNSEFTSSQVFLTWIKTREIGVLQKAIDPTPLIVVKAAISSFLEKTERIFFDVVNDTLMIDFIDENNNFRKKHIPWNILSDGYRNVIAMAADLAYKCVTLNPHLKEFAAEKAEGVVLIDEIDLHLHPKWQKRIVDSFKVAFPNLQFITTTHSPFIIQSLKNEELYDLHGKKMEDDYRRIGIEDISEGEMGVKEANRSERFLEMKRVAEEYYLLITAGQKETDKSKIVILKEQLDKLLIPFYDDPAYVAYLESFKYLLTNETSK